MIRVYVAGPMTGLPDFNHPAFHEAAEKLRGLGFEVENPAENPPPPCGTWEGWMRMAVRQLSTCDAAVFLPGWQKSKGAREEARLAGVLKVTCAPVDHALRHWRPRTA